MKRDGVQIPSAKSDSEPKDATAPGRHCSECGSEVDSENLLRLGPTYICAACKPSALIRIQEGAPIGQADRAMPHVVDTRVRVPLSKNLPHRCVLCNSQPVHRLEQRFTPTFPAWLLPAVLAPYFGGWLGRGSRSFMFFGLGIGLLFLLAIVFLHPFLSGWKPRLISIPVCRSHHQRRLRWLQAAYLLIATGLIGTVITWSKFGGHATPWFWSVGPATLVFMGALILWSRLHLVRLAPAPADCVDVCGTGSAFRDSLPKTID